LSRPSTPWLPHEDVDARDKPAHDAGRTHWRTEHCC